LTPTFPPIPFPRHHITQGRWLGRLRFRESGKPFELEAGNAAAGSKAKSQPTSHAAQTRMAFSFSSFDKPRTFSFSSLHFPKSGF
jgi:hypothetical protein